MATETGFEELVSDFKKSLESSPNESAGIAVINVLKEAIKHSNSQTWMGVDQELKQLIIAIQKACPTLPIHFQGAAQVFRAGMSKESEFDPNRWKCRFIDRAENCLRDARKALNSISASSCEFLQDGMAILTRGYDPMTASVFQVAAARGIKLHIVISEGRPRDDGVKMASVLNHPNLKVTVIPDSSVGLWMHEIDVVLIGTDLVLEDGGLLAPAGTYTICLLGSVHNKPVHCVCETFKFMRKFVLEADDLREYQRNMSYVPTGAKVACDALEFDFTPAKYVTLLLTEKGPMPPSAVTHELTKLLGVG
jgi:translation initiation factor 2B subunit (eIF-2B alpha/beta/delta family)